MCIFLMEFLPNIGLTSIGPVSMLISFFASWNRVETKRYDFEGVKTGTFFFKKKKRAKKKEKKSRIEKNKG